MSRFMKFATSSRSLTPSRLSQIIRQQKNPLTALEIFNSAETRSSRYRHNGPVYAVMIDILGSACMFSEMKEVVSRLKEEYCPSKDSVFNEAIKFYLEAGLVQDAIELFSEIPQFNCVDWTKSYNTLLQHAVERGELEIAYRLYIENTNRWEVKTCVRSFNLLIGALCNIQRSDLAIRVFEEMPEQCCHPDRDTYRILMKGLCHEGMLETATHLLYSMFWRISQKGCGADIVVYRILLEALCEHGQIEEANKILDKILKKGLKAPRRHYKHLDIVAEMETGKSSEDLKRVINNALIKGGITSSTSYHAMISDLYSEGRIEDGDRLLNEMYESGIRPSAVLYESKIMQLCATQRARQGAEVLAMEMVARNCFPRRQTYTLVIEGLCSEGKSRWAVDFLDKMVRQVGCCSSDRKTYEILVNGLCQEGWYIEASGILDKMLDRKHWPGEDSFNKVISGLCSMGRSYEAVMWLEEMIIQGKKPGTALWTCVVSAISTPFQKGMLYAAIELVTANV